MIEEALVQVALPVRLGEFIRVTSTAGEGRGDDGFIIGVQVLVDLDKVSPEAPVCQGWELCAAKLLFV